MAEKYKKHAILVGCVGKPNAGKSSFLNACSDAKAKVGNYPFTTIDPNQGVAFYSVNCPCAKYNRSHLCAPRYGKCVNGTRYLPVKVLDVAGLIPGASEGLGLGNKFLDDLRTASVLLHVIDSSGNTNEKGETTKGYDPCRDVEWLQQEIHSWIFNNIWKKWPNIVRKQSQTKLGIAETMQLQFSGYGSRLGLVQQVLNNLGESDAADLTTWDQPKVEQLVWEFIKERFPTILVLNKVDQETSDKNIAKICSTYDNQLIVPCSALAECFLKKLKQQRFIQYNEGTDDVKTSEDEDLDPAQPLIPLDDKNMARLEKIRDLVLFRYGSTGVQAAINLAIDSKKMLPVYWVKNLTTFQCDRTEGVFRDCTLVRPGTTAGDVFRLIYPDLQSRLAFIETISGQRVAEQAVITEENNILKFTVAVRES